MCGGGGGITELAAVVVNDSQLLVFLQMERLFTRWVVIQNYGMEAIT